MGSLHRDPGKGTSSFDGTATSVTPRNGPHERPDKRLHVVAQHGHGHEKGKGMHHMSGAPACAPLHPWEWPEKP